MRCSIGKGKGVWGPRSADIFESLLEENGRLDLSLETLEQQSKDKAEAAEKLAIARKERIVIETEKNPSIDQDINIASFARSSSNQKGQSIYSRPSFHTFNHNTECALLNNDSNAQTISCT